MNESAPIQHYENFPVASWLCPAHLRPPIAAIYHFARTADDIADEGDAGPAQRLAELSRYRDELARVAAGLAPQSPWDAVFVPLATMIRQFGLPVALLDDLLSAFMQDIARTEAGATYRDRAELLDYCRRSANPVGRLLLHLYGIDDATSLAQSDAICSALQLINFWQDLSVDIPRRRYYLCDADRERFGVALADMQAQQPSPAMQALISDVLQWADALMHSGAPLVHTVPGRSGWELRLVVQGGLAMLAKVRAQQGGSLLTRRTLGPLDAPGILLRALLM
ncbi:MAG: squalene synthase HpnC [Comamonas sp.]